MTENNLILSKYLMTAMDIEDKMSADVYQPYLERDAWPESLDEESFEYIKKSLDTLIKQTENHKQIFLGLQNNQQPNG